MEKPRIKPVLFPIQVKNHLIILGTTQPGLGSQIQDDDKGTVWDLIKLMDGSRSADEIISAMQRLHSNLSKKDVEQGIDTLTEKGFVEDADTPVPENLSPEELERYSRGAHYFAWIDRTKRPSPHIFQSKLKKSKVTIVGLGGAGGSVALGLAASGVGHLHLVDFDTVESSNLNRQILYKEADIGQKKITAAIRNLSAINSYIKVTGEKRKITDKSDLVKLMKKTDLLILCANEPYLTIREWTNSAALETGTAWIGCHYAGPLIGISLFKPWETPCYQCVLHQQEKERKIEPKDPRVTRIPPLVHGAIAPTVTIAGQMGALEAIYYLSGLTPKTLGGQFRQSLFLYDHNQIAKYEFWKDCPTCGHKVKR